MSFRGQFLGLSLLALTAALNTGCSSDESAEEDGQDEGELGKSGQELSTTQGALTLFQGYNEVLDQPHPSGCVEARGNIVPTVGEVGVEAKVQHVKSREDLARELEINADVGIKVPKTGGSARVKAMNGFKRSSSSTTLLVKIQSHYWVDAGQNYKLVPEYASMARSNPRGFLQRCGDGAITRLQYRAEIIALINFKSNDQQRTTGAAASAEVDPVKLGTVVEAQAKVGGSLNQMKSKGETNLDIQLFTSGMGVGADVTENLGSDSDFMGRIKTLSAKMAETIKADRDSDAANAKAGRLPVMKPSNPDTQPATPAELPVIKRSAVLGGLVYHGYSKGESESFGAVQALQEEVKAFIGEVGDMRSRLESVYSEEVNAFLDPATSDKETYNLFSSPKASTSLLTPIAQEWATALTPRAGDNSVTSRLVTATEKCRDMAIAGDLSACKRTEATAKLVADAKALLEKYNKEGRIVRMNLVYGSPATMVADEATAACQKSGGRVPNMTELSAISPAVAAQSGPIWVTSASCATNNRLAVFTGSGTPECYTGWGVDVWDRVLAATGSKSRGAFALCVGKTGPIPVLPPPGL